MLNKLQSLPAIGLIALLTAILSTTAMAQRASSAIKDLPSYYPASFQKTGVIRDVGTDDTLVISGIKYQISPQTKIHTVDSQFASSWSLKTDAEVGFSFATDDAKKRNISEIWLLPKGSVALH